MSKVPLQKRRCWLIDINSSIFQSKPSRYSWAHPRRVGRIDPSEYELWKRSKSEVTKTDEQRGNVNEAPDPSRPWYARIPARNVPMMIPSNVETGPSFDEIVELIATGKPVPGVRTIADQVSTETPSNTSTPMAPKKPWEKQMKD